jgi:hypothetical protein
MIAASSLTLSAFSQTSIDNGWNLLRDLPPQARIHVAGTSIDKTCNFVSANDDNLICSRGRTTSVQMAFSRPDVTSVRLTFLAESALAGASIRAGTSPHLGAVSDGYSPDAIDHLSDVILGMAALADRVMTSGIGKSIDVLRGSTIYQRQCPAVEEALGVSR